ncbi:vesicle-associated membrane protein 7-like [Pteropus vampyrus]|uniref:Vesicle-associated membrane protein 7 n=1 Tax=Pteropus vampyrus TaxID=132908 RepID=A0A6P3RM76_PTEVA|nr:vesicle-associated membrane protein 7-like [Pteropus vampyrus]
MAILFAVVARGTTILAKHAWCGGNFLEVTEQILAKIPSENNKLTYSHSKRFFLVHYPLWPHSKRALESVWHLGIKHHSENKGLDKVMETQAQVDELKGIMVRNIDLVAQRGERLELLIDKTENLVDSSVTFKTTSRNLARAMCMKNLKLTIIIIVVSIVFIYIIVSPLCGGFTWPSCVKK